MELSTNQQKKIIFLDKYIVFCFFRKKEKNRP